MIEVATEPQQPATIDWGAMQAMHVKGMSLKDIADEFGIPYATVRSRASREKWSHTVATANTKIVDSATRDLTSSANHWIGRIDKLVHKSLTGIERKSVDKLTLRELQTALDCAEKANRIARANYGLDKLTESKPASLTVNVAITGGATASPAVSLGQVIDVESVASGDDAKQLGSTDTKPLGNHVEHKKATGSK